MDLHLPDEIVQRAEANAADLRLALALQLYADNRLDYADALTLASMPPALFNQELLHRQLSIQPYPAANARRRAV